MVALEQDVHMGVFFQRRQKCSGQEKSDAGTHEGFQTTKNSLTPSTVVRSAIMSTTSHLFPSLDVEDVAGDESEVAAMVILQRSCPLWFVS